MGSLEKNQSMLSFGLQLEDVLCPLCVHQLEYGEHLIVSCHVTNMVWSFFST